MVMAEGHPRVVSMIASSTEIVCALGFEHRLVGRSHECDFPRSVSKLPVCTRPKLDARRSSRQIDSDVKSLLSRALSVYHVDGRTLRELRPDVVITQDQCEVCAVSVRDVENALCSWVEGRPRLVTLKPDSLADIWRDIARVARALGCEARGKNLVSRLKGRMAALSRKARSGGTGGPTVACIEWIDPLMAAGNLMPELVELAGGKNLFGEAGKHSPWLTWDELLAGDPDVIVALPCGFDIKRSREEIPALTRRRGWKRLKAVRTGRVFLADGNQFFNRPGPRVVDSLEILCEIFWPDSFAPAHPGGWEALA